MQGKGMLWQVVPVAVISQFMARLCLTASQSSSSPSPPPPPPPASSSSSQSSPSPPSISISKLAHFLAFKRQKTPITIAQLFLARGLNRTVNKQAVIVPPLVTDWNWPALWPSKSALWLSDPPLYLKHRNHQRHHYYYSTIKYPWNRITTIVIIYMQKFRSKIKKNVAKRVQRKSICEHT